MRDSFFTFCSKYLIKYTISGVVSINDTLHVGTGGTAIYEKM